MKEKNPHIKIYCDDLEKMIAKDGCYDAKGSTPCMACLGKPAPKKVKTINKNKKRLTDNRIKDTCYSHELYYL